MAVNILSQEPPQLHDNLISTTETGKDDDRLSLVHIVEPSEDMSTRVYVGNLGYDVDDRDLYYFFYQFGPVEHARVIINRNGFSKGYGFVTFHGQEVAKIVIEVAKRDSIWMNGRMLRVGAARKSNWIREVGPGHVKRRLNDKDSDEKVYNNDDTIDTKPTEFQPLTNGVGYSVDFGTASYQLYYCPTKTASYPVHHPPPYPQISGQDMPYYPTPWYNMSYTPTQSYTVPIAVAPVDPSYSSYQYQGAVLTEQPTEQYWEHQDMDTHMYMVTYDNTQCGYSSVEYLTPTENHQEGFQCQDVSNRNNIQTYHQLEWGTGARTDYMDTHIFVNTGDSYLCDSGFQESVLETNESKGQVTALSIGQDEADHENQRGGMQGKHERKTDPVLEEESRDNIGEVPIENYQNSKRGGGSTLKKNSAGNETAVCRKIVNNGGTEGPCHESTPAKFQFQGSLEKLKIK